MIIIIGVYYNQNKFTDDSEPLYIECLQKRRQVLGEQHPDTITTMLTLANLYYHTKNFDKAEKLYIECLQKSKELYGDDHPDTLQSSKSLNRVRRDMSSKQDCSCCISWNIFNLDHLIH